VNAQHPTGFYKMLQETPGVIENCLQGEVAEAAKNVGLEFARRGVKRAYLYGAGSSHFAAIATEYALNEIAGMDTDTYQAHEFLYYRMGAMNPSIAALGFSNSGGTKVSHLANLAAKRAGALTVSFTDDIESPLAKSGDYLIHGGAGKEPVGPKTRSVMNTILMGYQIATAVKNDTTAHSELFKIAPAMKTSWALEEALKVFAEKTKGCNRAVIVGGGVNWAAAQELAPKFEETAPLPSKAFQVEDSLHGPLPSIDEGSLVITLSVAGPSYDKVGDLLKTASLVGAPCLAITTIPYDIPGVENVKISAPGVREVFSAPLTLFAGYIFVYWAVLARDGNPDGASRFMPRHVAARKSITKVAY